MYLRRVWRYQRGNHNPYIEEQTTQWPKEKVQKDKQRSTKHTHKTKDRVTRTPLKLGWTQVLWTVSSSCSTSGTSRFNLVKKLVISHKWGKDLKVFTQVEYIRGHLWNRYYITDNWSDSQYMSCKAKARLHSGNLF
jgi:hypothetical protein